MNRTKEDARKRVQDMMLGSFVDASEEYLLALRDELNKYMLRLNSQIATKQEPYEVWDSEYHGKDSDIQEVVYSGTKEECQKFIDDFMKIPRYTIHRYGARFTITRAGCD